MLSKETVIWLVRRLEEVNGIANEPDIMNLTSQNPQRGGGRETEPTERWRHRVGTHREVEGENQIRKVVFSPRLVSQSVRATLCGLAGDLELLILLLLPSNCWGCGNDPSELVLIKPRLHAY